MRMSVGQLAFDISLDTIYRLENFYISPSNSDSVSIINNWPKWNSRIQLIYGSSCCGKTHIAHLWKQESRASFVNKDILKLDFLAEYVEENPFLIFEDADRLKNFNGLFHLYNLINEYQGYLLITARSLPNKWQINLPDLFSRMQSIPAIEIKAPDDSLLEALLIKRFSDFQLKVPEAVSLYILKHVQRSYIAIDNICNSLNQLSLEKKRNLTIPLVKEVLVQGNA